MSHNSIIVYHADCVDGLVSAAIAKACLPDAVALPYSYKRSVFDINVELEKGDQKKTLYILDFSFKGEDFAVLKFDRIKHVVWCDHHQVEEFIPVYEYQCAINHVQLTTCIDRTLCGAQLTYQYFKGTYYKFPLMSKIDKEVRQPIDRFLNLIQDWDLWIKKYPESRYLRYALSLYFNNLDKLVNDLFILSLNKRVQLKESKYNTLLVEGKAIVKYLDIQIKNQADPKRWVRTSTYGEHNVVFINCPKFIHSDVMHEILNNHPEIEFVVNTTYDHITPNDIGTVIDLRSRKDGFDCAKLAKRFGGGGHHSAAGITFRDRAEEERFIMSFLFDKE